MRLVLLILLAFSGPYWLLFRQGFGRYFYLALIAANLLGFALANATEVLLTPQTPEEFAYYRPHRYVEFYGTALFAAWFWHIPAALTGAKYWRRDHKPAAWSAGHFHFWRGAPLITDAILFLLLAPSLYYAYLGDPEQPTSIILVGSVISYFFIASLAYFNAGVLPFKGQPATRRSKPRAAPKPNQTSLRNMPKADNEGLAQIFSRRHRALNDIVSRHDN